MEKLKLNLDDLKVESFDTTPEGARDAKGTIFGYASQAGEETCSCGCGPGGTGGAACTQGCPTNTCNTCYYTCDGYATCGAGNTCVTCGYTCECT